MNLSSSHINKHTLALFAAAWCVLVALAAPAAHAQPVCNTTWPYYVNITNLPNFTDVGGPASSICSYASPTPIYKNEGANSTIFYWFFYNYTQPDLPIVLWLQGGPGSSGLIGLFKEEGPLQLIKTSTTPQLAVRNDSWLQYAHLIFVDQPTGTGFSWSDGEYAQNETEVANDMMIFLVKFVEQYNELNFTNRKWFIIGESYGGKYAPSIAQFLIQKGGGINIAGLGLIDPLVYPLVQKTTSRTEVYGGLSLMSPQQVSQYQTLQQRCANDIVNASANPTHACSSTEDYMSATTNGLDLQDVRRFSANEGPDLINQYFNGQVTQVEYQILATLNIGQQYTPKVPPAKIWASEPGVYNTLAQNNDIYGKTTIPALNFLVTQMPVIIMEGIFDTMDGILPLENYVDAIFNNNGTCTPRQLLSVPLSNAPETCQARGYFQTCNDATSLGLTIFGVWGAGHMVPYNQLAVSEYILERFLANGTQAQYCGENCECSVDRCKALNKCNGNGQCKTSNSRTYCECYPGFGYLDCSQQFPNITLQPNVTLPQQANFEGGSTFLPETRSPTAGPRAQNTTNTTTGTPLADAQINVLQSGIQTYWFQLPQNGTTPLFAKYPLTVFQLQNNDQDVSVTFDYYSSVPSPNVEPYQTVTYPNARDVGMYQLQSGWVQMTLKSNQLGEKGNEVGLTGQWQYQPPIEPHWFLAPHAWGFVISIVIFVIGIALTLFFVHKLRTLKKEDYYGLKAPMSDPSSQSHNGYMPYDNNQQNRGNGGAHNGQHNHGSGQNHDGNHHNHNHHHQQNDDDRHNHHHHHHNNHHHHHHQQQETHHHHHHQQETHHHHHHQDTSTGYTAPDYSSNDNNNNNNNDYSGGGGGNDYSGGGNDGGGGGGWDD